MLRKVVLLVFLSVFSVFCVLSQASSKAKLNNSDSANLKQGAEAYKNEDWTSAIFFLRKVVSVPGFASDENLFMLIKSEVYAGEYRQAQNDCEKFLEQFAFSPYAEYVKYQNGRLLHLLSRNEDAVLSLSDFCHQHSDSDLYPLALFWIAESFYDEYNFESARGLYERVVNDYPACEKAPQAQYKLDLIERRSREEKLLYLLKVIGEENLSTREEYERQLRVYALDDENGVRSSLLDAQARIAELEALLEQGGSSVDSQEDESIASSQETPEPSVADAEKTGPAKQAEPQSSGISKPQNPTVHVIQSVTEPSFRVKQTKTGQGTTAIKKAEDTERNADVQVLKRKAKQLQYLLEEQSEEAEK